MNIFYLVLAIGLLPLPSSTAQAFQFPHIPGWKLSGDVQTFGPKTLFEHINGAADLYLASDFEELKVAEYVDEKKASVIVEVYRHRTPRDAFGIYSQERLSEGALLEIGAQGYIDREILNFLQGRYYVKLNSFNTGARDAELLQAVAKRVAMNLGEGGRLPPVLSAFPAEGKKSHSEKYITRNFLGYPFFNAAYTADYEIAGRTFKLFLIEAADKQTGRGIVETYLRLTKTPVREVSEGRHTVTDPHHGVIDLFWKEAYIWGTVDLADADLRSRFLQSFEKNIMPGKRAP